MSSLIRVYSINKTKNFQLYMGTSDLYEKLLTKLPRDLVYVKPM